MKRILTVIFTAVILLPMLFSCAEKETVPSSSSVYGMFFETSTEYNSYCHIAAYTSDSAFTAVTVDSGRPHSAVFTEYDSAGAVLGETKITLPDEVFSIDGAYCGSRGIYIIWDTGRTSSPYTLSLFGYDGTPAASVNLSTVRPDGVTMAYPGDYPTAQEPIPMTETDEYIVLLWQSTLLFFDDTLTLRETVKLPGKSATAWNDNGLRVTYIKDNKPMTAGIENGSVTDACEMPGRFGRDKVCFFACENGTFYAYDTSGAFRWNLNDGAKSEPAEFCSFTASGINGSSVSRINAVRTHDNRLTDADFPQIQVYYSVSNYDRRAAWMHLSTEEPMNPDEVTTIVIATPGMGRNAPQAVVDFNQSHSDIQIVVEDYSKYSIAENPDANYTRLRMDLETGVLKPDLIVAQQPYYADFLRGMGTYFADLDAVMTENPDAGISPDNIWQSVRSAFTYEGGMRGITPSFSLRGPVGLKKYIGDACRMTLADLLDYAETLPDGVYLTESLTRKDTFDLFGNMQWDTFTAQGNFDDPLYVRYLEFLKSLPSQAPELITRETAYDPEFGVTVDVTEDPHSIYRDGTVRFLLTQTASPMGYLTLMQRFGTEDPDDLNFIGYPTNDAGGMKLVNQGECVYMIPAGSAHIAEAWEFVAFMLRDYADSLTELNERDINKYGSRAPSALREETLAYFATLIGYQTWETVRGGHSGWNLETDGEGTLLTVTEDVLAGCAALLDQETCSYLFTETPASLAAIITEEESGYLSGTGDAASAAKTTQSRAAIWLAEHGR